MRVVLIGSDVGLDHAERQSAQVIFERLGGNTGNIAFVNAIRSHIDDPVTHLPWHASAEQIREQGDVIVLGCANQLGQHTDLSLQADVIEAAKLPVVALGLGAQSKTQAAHVHLTTGTRRWVEAIAHHAPGRGPS